MIFYRLQTMTAGLQCHTVACLYCSSKLDEQHLLQTHYMLPVTVLMPRKL